MVATEKKTPTVAQILAKHAKKDLRIGGMDQAMDKVPVVTSNNVGIDYVFGCGGAPLGRLIEAYGPPSSGKTTMAMHLAACCQQQFPSKKVIYGDWEHAVDKKYARQVGLDTDAVLFMQPDFLEQGAEAIKELISTGQISMVIFDSVAAMTPEKLFDADIGKGQIALQARVMASFLNPFVSQLAHTGTMAFFLNHMGDVLDTTPMGQQMAARGIKRYTTPGVKTITAERIDPLSNSITKQRVANNVQITSVKNKVAPPYRQAVVQVRYGLGFLNSFTVIETLVGHKVLRKDTGGIFRLAREWVEGTGVEITGVKDGYPYIRGEESLMLAMESNPKFMARMSARAQGLIEASTQVPSRQQILQSLQIPSEAEEVESDLLTSDELDALIAG
jgi:recombination protein RecA